MAAKDDALRRLLDAHQDKYKTIERATLAKVEAIWRASPAYRDKDIAALIKKLRPILHGSQIRVAESEALLIARYLTADTGVKVAAAAVDAALIDATIYDRDAYLRQPALALYTDLSRGVPFRDAVDRGARVLGGLVQHSLGEARAAQAHASYTGAGVTTYNRVLSGTACDFCRRVIGAGKAEYRTSSGLRPLHTHCDCGYRPAPGTTVSPPGPADLARERNRAKAADLKARKAEPAAQRKYLDESLAKAEDHETAVRAKWGGDAVDDLPLETRKVAKKEIGIAKQRTVYAKRAATPTSTAKAAAPAKVAPATAPAKTSKPAKAAAPKPSRPELGPHRRRELESTVRTSGPKIRALEKKLDGIQKWQANDRTATRRGGNASIGADGFATASTEAERAASPEVAAIRKQIESVKRAAKRASNRLA